MVKNPPAHTGDTEDSGSILGSGRLPGVGNGSPLQYFCLENQSVAGYSPWGSQSVRSDWACMHVLFNCIWFISISNAFCFTTDYKESWALKNWCFWTVVLAKTLESPLDCKEIQPGHGPQCSLEGMMLKLKLQYFGHLMWKVDSLERLWCWEGFWAGGEGDDRGWDGWMASRARWTWVWVNSGRWNGWGGPACCNSWGRKESDMTERLNWTELNGLVVFPTFFKLSLILAIGSSWSEPQ